LGRSGITVSAMGLGCWAIMEEISHLLCGFVSGKKVDKGALFETFYGKLKTAPMIRQYPANMECELVRTLDDLSRYEVFVGKIVETYCDEEYLTDGNVDFAKLHPILYITDGSYA
jgi:flavin reductase (DIM6/NTAB) family NADH-FMN oxidoreductase RutF